MTLALHARADAIARRGIGVFLLVARYPMEESS